MANPSLQLRLTQKLALAPQLQQAIRLLQLNRIELRDYIQELVDANPLLDHDDNTEQAGTSHEAISLETQVAETRKTESAEDYSTDEYETDQWQAEPGLEQWGDSGGWSDGFSERQIADTSTTSLREHLLAQIRIAHFSEIDAAIAKALSEGYRTKDISMYDAKEVCSTSEMGSIIANYAAQCKH